MVKFTISLISALTYLKLTSSVLDQQEPLNRIKRQNGLYFGDYGVTNDYEGSGDYIDFGDSDEDSTDPEGAFVIEYEYDLSQSDIDKICEYDTLNKLEELAGEFDPNEIADVTCKGDADSIDSLDDCVSACESQKAGGKRRRKLGTTYSRWKAVSRMIQHVVTNTTLSRKQLIRKMLNYGCHCFPGTRKRRSVGGKGPAMDEIDSVCKQQYHCHKCIKLVHQCDPDRTGYRVKFIGKRRSLVRDISCKGEEGTCSRDLCECDKEMAYSLSDLWDDSLHSTYYWGDKKNINRNEYFDYEGTCKATGNGGGSDACCGNFPNIIPYNSMDRTCCATDPTKPRTYNPNSHDCCPSGGVNLIGSC